MGAKLRVGVLGAGYWGPNVIRTFNSLQDAEVAYVCDQRPGRLQYIAERFPGITLTDRYDDLLEDATLDAIAIVTPVSTHRRLATAALEAGKHVFVEKPLAGSTSDAIALVEAAERAQRTLATGHVFVYHPSIELLRSEVRRGALGQPCYAESARVNPGPPATEVSVVWDLAVHDVAILLSIVDSSPRFVSARGKRCVHPSLTDVAFITIQFANGFLAQIHVSWLSPIRVRRLFMAGGSATFDDTLIEGKLSLVGRGEDSRIGATDAESRELAYRPGEILRPEISTILPLTAECAHFVDCVRNGRSPLADGRAGLAVVRVLEAAETSIARDGEPLRFDE